MMALPDFIVIPTSLLCGDLPDHLYRTHQALWASANGSRWCQVSVGKLATLRRCSKQTIRWHLEELEKRGYIRRIPVQGRASRIELLFPEGASWPEGLPSSSSEGAVGHRSNRLAEVNVAETISDQQQQAIIRALVGFGVTRSAAISLAARKDIDLEAVEEWIAYASRPQAGLRNPAGFVVARLGAGERVPRPYPQEDRRRYISGQFKDFIRH